MHQFTASDGSLVRDGQTLRQNYACTHREIKTGADLRATLRAGPFAWPGGYPLFLLTNEGDTLSFAAAFERIEEETRAIRLGERSRIVACDVNWEDPDMLCAHLGHQIPSAYKPD